MLRCDAVCGGGVREGTVPLAQLSDGFQSLAPLPTSKLGPSGADSLVGGFVYVLGPCGSLQQTAVRLGVSPSATTSMSFTARVFEALFPHAGTLGSVVCIDPQFFLPVYVHANVGPPAPPTAALPSPPATDLLGVLSTPAASPPLLPVWMNVSALTPWLSDFHTARFSVSSGCTLFFNLLLSFFWLCKEVKCIYLHLHLG